MDPNPSTKSHPINVTNLTKIYLEDQDNDYSIGDLESGVDETDSFISQSSFEIDGYSESSEKEEELEEELSLQSTPSGNKRPHILQLVKDKPKQPDPRLFFSDISSASSTQTQTQITYDYEDESSMSSFIEHDTDDDSQLEPLPQRRVPHFENIRPKYTTGLAISRLNANPPKSTNKKPISPPKQKNKEGNSKKINAKMFKQTQAFDSSGDRDDEDEEEDVMLSSDKRFLASQSQIPNHLALYRLIDMTQRWKPKEIPPDITSDDDDYTTESDS